MHKQSRSRWPWRKNRRFDDVKTSRLAKVIDHNIQVIDEYRAEVEQQKSFQDHLADWITRWSGSMWFVYMHIAWFALWVGANIELFGIEPFDPFPFGLLTTIVSLEAIFLSTFVLVSQNRQAELADRRSELDLQINLLAEYEMTRVLSIVDAIAKHLDISEVDGSELEELMEDVQPDEILQELEERAKPEASEADEGKGK